MSLWRAVVNLTIPGECLLCGDADCPVSRAPICDACWRSIPSSIVRVSGPPSLMGVHSLGPYDGPLGTLVCQAKYRSRLGIVDVLSRRLGAALAGCFHVDVVTHVPIHWSRRWRRGFDQGERIGRGVGAVMGVPFVPLLTRRHGPQQVGQSATERKRLQPSNFELFQGSVPRRVLLVDDVRTTGASLHAAARVLNSAGAEQVWGATLCHQNERNLYK